MHSSNADPMDAALALARQAVGVSGPNPRVGCVIVDAGGQLLGQTALASGQSQWITGDAARADGHAWRARANVVLTGIGTVLEDNPRLDVRLVPAPRQPDAVLVDSRLQLPPDANLFVAGRHLFVYSAIEDAARQQALQDRGATVVQLPGAGGKVDLAALLRDSA